MSCLRLLPNQVSWPEANSSWKNYLAFTFQDDSGEIEGKLWDAQPHNVEAFTAGKVVHMKGRREVL